jgi:hypothetical protein
LVAPKHLKQFQDWHAARPLDEADAKPHSRS